MYLIAVLSSCWAQDSFCAACSFWVPCYISTNSWTMAIDCYFLWSASFFISEPFPVYVVSDSGLLVPKIALLHRANCLTTTFSQRVAAVVFDCLNLIWSRRREKLVSTPTPCRIIENMSRDSMERSAYIEWVSSCWPHQSVLSGIQSGLLNSIGSEW